MNVSDVSLGTLTLVWRFSPVQSALISASIPASLKEGDRERGKKRGMKNRKDADGVMGLKRLSRREVQVQRGDGGGGG